MLKRCRDCQQEKALDDFYDLGHTKDKKASYCKVCSKVRALESQARKRAGLKKTKTWVMSPRRLQMLAGQAKRRGVAFTLTPDDFARWWLTSPDVCFYCGASTAIITRIRDAAVLGQGLRGVVRAFASPTHAVAELLTIDRINNNSGYHADNIAKACWVCNLAKGAFFDAQEMRLVAPSLIARALDAIRTRHIDLDLIRDDWSPDDMSDSA